MDHCFCLIRFKHPNTKRFGHQHETEPFLVRNLVPGNIFNNKHEFTQSWGTASDWSAPHERKCLFVSANVSGAEEGMTNP